VRRSSELYVIVLLVWITLVVAAWTTFWQDIDRAWAINWYAGVGVVASVIFMIYFWLNGTKTLAYTLFYYARLKRSKSVTSQISHPTISYDVKTAPRVVLVYCTRNDFNSDSLKASMRQAYSNFETVILDDSTDKNYKVAIDVFAKAQAVKVIRRSDRVGFKAGNLNNYLKHASYDYFVLLDSDEIIPKDFITKSLDYFTQDDSVGIVQGSHVAAHMRNQFTRTFARSIESQNMMFQSIKQQYGFIALEGHGAMVSRECYMAAGGFPHVVSEDICFSINARNNDFTTVFAPDIVCKEEYPVDYFALKQRQSKWIQGNVEFIQQYTAQIIRAKIRWYEKLDVLLHTYNLPVHTFFSVFVPINAILLPAVHFHLKYPLWMLGPTIIFFITPMLNDIIYYYRKLSIVKLAWYLTHTSLLYGSMFFISLWSILKAVFGMPSFPVTPKSARNPSFLGIFGANIPELVLAGTLFWIAGAIDKDPFLVALVALPSITSIYFSTLAKREYTEVEI
jgi:cellulose synthase/poly-beta-1,6-N-acetylglucosamine synthase-like glycosyltransferase